jgi:MoxR-like ATPase
MNLTVLPDDQFAPLVARFRETVVVPLQQAFVGKDEVLDVLSVGLIGRENVFLLGPPGTAKSGLVQGLGQRLGGRVFDYLLTRFTEPSELFGPFDIRKLREGELLTNTEGMLPEADLVFLDELLNANSAILNSLLLALNERVFRRGRETRQLPLVMVVGASNQLPQDEALTALFDRFLLRVQCLNVPQEQLVEVLRAGWELEHSALDQHRAEPFGIAELRLLQRAVGSVDVTAVRPVYLELLQRLRHAGFAISDRRAVKFQRLLAASAVLCGRQQAQPSDLWVLRYTWDLEEQQDVLQSIVDDTIAEQGSDDVHRHPRAEVGSTPDPELLARDLERLEERFQRAEVTAADLAYLRDQLSHLAARCEWVHMEPQAAVLRSRVERLWQRVKASIDRSGAHV